MSIASDSTGQYLAAAGGVGLNYDGVQYPTGIFTSSNGNEQNMYLLFLSSLFKEASVGSKRQLLYLRSGSL